MEITPLTPAGSAEWDTFMAASPDAWLWHTTGWSRYIDAYDVTGSRENKSFWVRADGHPLAAVPAFLERWPKGAMLANSGEPLPAPAAAPGLSAQKKREVLEFAVEHLKRIAAENGVEAFQLRIPALARSVCEASPPPGNPLLRIGGLDLPWQTQLLDLRRPIDELWADVRHGFSADVRKAEKTLSAAVWSGPGLTDAKFAEYQALHAKDSGRVTRSQTTFDMMRGWIRSDGGALAEVTLDGRPIAFTMVLISGSGAFYASTCKDPDVARLPSSHLAQWTLVKWLKERGVKFYDLGIQRFGVQWFDKPSPKDMGISLFKRGLGGVSAPLFTAEFHQDLAATRRALAKRLDENLADAPNP